MDDSAEKFNYSGNTEKKNETFKDFLRSVDKSPVNKTFSHQNTAPFIWI